MVAVKLPDGTTKILSTLPHGSVNQFDLSAGGKGISSQSFYRAADGSYVVMDDPQALAATLESSTTPDEIGTSSANQLPGNTAAPDGTGAVPLTLPTPIRGIPLNQDYPANRGMVRSASQGNTL
jgi:hypothetical protein